MRRARSRGNSAIELAVSFAVLFSVFTGTFQFGYTFYLYNRLETAVRSGARYASMATYDSNTSTPSAGFTHAVRNTVVYGDPAGGSAAIVPGLTTDKVTVTMIMVDGVPERVEVSISNFRMDALFGSHTLNGKPSVVFPYVGRYAGS